MSISLYAQLLYLLCGGLLLSSVLMLWRRQLSALITLLTGQGVMLAGIAALCSSVTRCFWSASAAMPSMPWVRRLPISASVAEV